MLVALIVIPILILYFYIRTKNEAEIYLHQWQNVNRIEENAIVSGHVARVHGEKQRYYQRKYIYVLHMMVNNGSLQYKVIKKDPIVEGFTPKVIKKGDFIKCIGTWDEDCFIVSRFITIK